MACFGALSVFAAVYTDLPFRNQKLGSGTKYIGMSSSEGPLEKKNVKLYSSYIWKKKVCAYFAICTHSLGILQERLCT
jgi:hypothetical protein